KTCSRIASLEDHSSTVGVVLKKRHACRARPALERDGFVTAAVGLRMGEVDAEDRNLQDDGYTVPTRRARDERHMRRKRTTEFELPTLGEALDRRRKPGEP